MHLHTTAFGQARRHGCGQRLLLRVDAHARRRRVAGHEQAQARALADDTLALTRRFGQAWQPRARAPGLGHEHGAESELEGQRHGRSYARRLGVRTG